MKRSIQLVIVACMFLRCATTLAQTDSAHRSASGQNTNRSNTTVIQKNEKGIVSNSNDTPQIRKPSPEAEKRFNQKMEENKIKADSSRPKTSEPNYKNTKHPYTHPIDTPSNKNPQIKRESPK